MNTNNRIKQGLTELFAIEQQNLYLIVRVDAAVSSPCFIQWTLGVINTTMSVDSRLRNIIEPLFASYQVRMVPADDSLLTEFRHTARHKNVPENVINELVEFYKVTNGIPCLDIDFFSCDNDMLYELWDNGEIWLGQKDSDLLRWTNNKYCLGSAGWISYSKEYEFDSLIDLLEHSLKEWNIA